MTTALRPFYKEIQAHYDLSNEFFELFLDPSMTYSCAYFERDDMTLEEAEWAKIDLALCKCGLQPGQRLLDVGCGWGATLRRAVEKFGVRAVGLTLSRAQAEYARERLAYLGDQVEVRLQGWEEFDEPIDRIVTIGAIEHFREERYAAFFEKCYRLLPAGAPMLVHSIVYPEDEAFNKAGLEFKHEDVQFIQFINRKIFPGGQLRPASVICRYAESAGFRVTRLHSLQPHYARTLDCWAANLKNARERAIQLTSEENYEMYMKYLTGCGRYYRSGHVDLMQISLRKE